MSLRLSENSLKLKTKDRMEDATNIKNHFKKMQRFGSFYETNSQSMGISNQTP